MKSLAVVCQSCGQEWPRDPCLEVPCPMCGAKIGGPCRRPSGHRVWSAFPFHPERERAAMAAGFIRPCPAARKDSPTSAQQPSLL